MDLAIKPRRALHPRPQDLIGFSEEKCQQRLLTKLLELKEKQVLKQSLLPTTDEFERLEFYGDACLYQTISLYIMTTRRFMNPHLMSSLRMYCIKNANLADVFDRLGLSTLLKDKKDGHDIAQKSKADVLEAILGELSEEEADGAALSELTNFIAYLGEKAFFAAQAPPPAPPQRAKAQGRQVQSQQPAHIAAPAPPPTAPSDSSRQRRPSPPPLSEPLFLMAAPAQPPAAEQQPRKTGEWRRRSKPPPASVPPIEKSSDTQTASDLKSVPPAPKSALAPKSADPKPKSADPKPKGAPEPKTPKPKPGSSYTVETRPQLPQGPQQPLPTVSLIGPHWLDAATTFAQATVRPLTADSSSRKLMVYQ